MTSQEFLWLWGVVLITTAILFKRRIIPDIISSDTSGIFGEVVIGGIIGIVVGILAGAVFWALQAGIPYEEVHLGSARIGLVLGLTIFWGVLTLFMLLTETTALAVAVMLANIIALLVGNISVFLTQGTMSLMVTLVVSIVALFVWIIQIIKKLGNT